MVLVCLLYFFPPSFIVYELQLLKVGVLPQTKSQNPGYLPDWMLLCGVQIHDQEYVDQYIYICND